MKALILGVAIATLAAGSAFAAETAAATTTAKTKVAKPAVVHSEISKKCSAEADAQKLHGKARKDFRKTCMKPKAN